MTYIILSKNKVFDDIFLIIFSYHHFERWFSRNFGIEDDTIVVFMSDNGAISRADAVSATQPYPEGSYMWDTYQ